jgi:hypothetical protein
VSGVRRGAVSGELRGVVLVELEYVAGEVQERPFAADCVKAAATEAADPLVVFAVTEDGFDQAGALFVGVGALGGSEQVFHLVGR